MKKTFILVLLFISISYTLDAQIFYGFKVGANYSSFNGDLENASYKAAAHFGGVVEIQMSELLSIQPEILLSMQGYQNSEDNNYKVNYTYATLPIMAKYFINGNITIDAGPQIGYLLAANSTDGEFEETNLKDHSNKLDYGFNIGASLELDEGMFVNLRYNYGFANISDTDLDYKITNSVIQLALGYKFY